MYIIRFSSRTQSGVLSGYADGVFIRKDGNCTGNALAAKLFSSVPEAEQFIDEWRVITKVEYYGDLFVLEVSTEPMVREIKDTVKQLKGKQ